MLTDFEIRPYVLIIESLYIYVYVSISDTIYIYKFTRKNLNIEEEMCQRSIKVFIQVLDSIKN